MCIIKISDKNNIIDIIWSLKTYHIRLIDITSIMCIINILSVMPFITITFSAWVSFLKPKFQKMSSIRWKRPSLINEIFFTTAPLAEYLQWKRLEVKHLPNINETDTYKSSLASSKSSRVFSDVGWKMGMSKYFIKKGHIALSRTRKVKNLSRQHYMSQENKWYNWNNINKAYNWYNSLRQIPERRRWCFDPEFASRSEDINRQTVFLMGFQITIYTTQIADEIV